MLFTEGQEKRNNQGPWLKNPQEYPSERSHTYGKKIPARLQDGSKHDFYVSIENAKEGLTLDEAKTAAAKILPVLTTKSGVEVISFEKAVLTTTTQEVLE